MLIPDVESGATVRFKLESVVCPNVHEVIERVTKNLKLTGKVLFLSDAGEERNHFAIVEVNGIVSPLIVPVSQIENCRPLASPDEPERTPGIETADGRPQRRADPLVLQGAETRRSDIPGLPGGGRCGRGS